jgi:hypothetical protein
LIDIAILFQKAPQKGCFLHLNTTNGVFPAEGVKASFDQKSFYHEKT